MWELNIGLIGFAIVLVATIIQLCLEHFWGERPTWLRRRWAYILGTLVIAGAVVNEIEARQRQAEEREERERIDFAAKARAEQARQERQGISENIRGLVTLAREQIENMLSKQ